MKKLLFRKVGISHLLASRLSSSNPYFVSTPIFYVNGDPHIGHLQSCLYADAFARMQRLLGKEVIFSTGTDEHGLKVQQVAEAKKRSPKEYCLEMSNKFKGVFADCDISFTHFIQTTDEKHKDIVQNFWNKINDKGYIKKGQYEGWYSITDEAFVPSSQIKEIKEGSNIKMVSIENGSVLEKMCEENYVFSLPLFEKDLLHWLSTDVIKPRIFLEEVKRWIGEGLFDLSVSRPCSRLSWGIPVPGDNTQIIYVWLDALVNYLTVGSLGTNVIWPANCHIIGKDILKFHAIYWPAFLIAAGYEPPKKIFCHSHWTVNYEKMSKSKGNVVDPRTLMEEYSCDGFRYFLLRASVPHSDTNYSGTKIHRMLNAELADTLGNLLSRSCAPALNREQIFPKFYHEALKALQDGHSLIEEASRLPDKVQQNFLEGDFHKGIDCLMACVRNANAFMQVNTPWALAKEQDIESQQKLATILHITLEVLRISGILLQPVIPTLSNRLLVKLGVPTELRTWKNVDCFHSFHHKPNPFEGKSLSKESGTFFDRRKKSFSTA